MRKILAANPDLNKAVPEVAGFWWVPYAANYDDQIMGNDISGIKQ